MMEKWENRKLICFDEKKNEKMKNIVGINLLLYPYYLKYYIFIFNYITHKQNRNKQKQDPFKSTFRLPMVPYPGQVTRARRGHQRNKKLLEILEDCIVFLNEKIYISVLYRKHKCAVQVKCSTSISVLYK